MRTPSFSELSELFESSIDIIERQRADLVVEGKLVLLPEKGEAVILGDLHGDYASLNKIIKDSKLEKRLLKKDNYLICLGDYVDRGPYQIQVIHRLMRLLAQYPEKVILLRGNHEGPSDIKVSPHNYPEHLHRIYGATHERLHLQSIELFEKLCTGCLIENQALLLHGGIPTEADSLEDIAYAHMSHPEKSLLSEILWNDPSTLRGVSYSFRGVGKMFGLDIASKYLENIGAKMLIRGHECYDHGYYFHDDKILTIFSCKLPHYRNTHLAYLKADLEKDFTKENLLRNIVQL